MKLLVILLLAGHGALGGPTVSSKAKRITPLSNTANEKIKNKQAINKGEIARARNNKQLHVFSEEIYEENPTRERETDKDYLKQFIKDFLKYNTFKHLYKRDNNGRKNRFNLGIPIGSNENELADVADAKVPENLASEDLSHSGARSLLPRPRKRWWKTLRGRYVTGKFKKRPKRLSQTLEKEVNYKNYEVELRNMAKTLAKYLQYSKIDENNKYLENSKGKLVNKVADMEQNNVVLEAEVSQDVVNRILSEIKLLLTTHKGNSQLYVSRILNIIRKNEENLIYHPNQACRKSKLTYLIHGINTVYQRYLTNAECDGEYLDTGLDVISWILSNRNDIKADRERMDSSGEDESNYGVKEKLLNSYSDYSSGEARLSKNLEKKRNKKTKDVKRSLKSDDTVKLTSEELKSDGGKRDSNIPLLDLYIKSRLLRALRSMIFHKSDPYYKEIEKLFTKQENANTGLDSIRLVCEKIASEQFLHSVEAIIWKLLHNADCKPENALKVVKEKNDIKPVFEDLTKHRIDAYSSQESSYDDILDFTNVSDEGSLKYSTSFDNGRQNDEDAYSEYEVAPLNFKQFVIPVSDTNLRNKHKRLRDYTLLRNDHLANIFNGLGKVNSLKAIKQKFKSMNVKDYKKLMDNLPVIEKLLKIVYKKLPPQLQAVLDVLKTGALKMVEDESFSLKKIPSLLMGAFLEGKGKDLLKMMADKFKKEKLKSTGKIFKKFRDETVLRNKLNQSNLLVDYVKLQATPEHEQLNRLPHVEVPSGIEKKDQPVIELTYVFNHPPVIHYKPKFIVKHNITYDQYLKNIKSIYNNDLRSADSQVQLVKVVKKEGNESHVFYETDIPNSVVENSNKSATFKLYDQFYNSTINDEKKPSAVDTSRAKQGYSNNEREIKVLKSTPPTEKGEIYHTDNTVSPIVNLKQSIELNPKDIKSEETARSVSKSNEYALNHNDSRSEEVIFDNAHSVELDNSTTPKPHSSNKIGIGREGKIQWNEYPIIRPKYNNKRKRSISQHKDKGVRK